MMLPSYARQIEDIVCSGAQSGQVVVALLDRYAALTSEPEREAFVSALIHQMMISRTRLKGLPKKQEAGPSSICSRAQNQCSL
jgi:hypothetical protein